MAGANRSARTVSCATSVPKRPWRPSTKICEPKNFDVAYPADYPDAKLAGKTYHYAVEVLGLKTKQLPELNDEFAKDVSDAGSLDELKGKLRQSLEAARDQKHKDLLREKVLAAVVKQHDSPVLASPRAYRS